MSRSLKTGLHRHRICNIISVYSNQKINNMKKRFIVVLMILICTNILHSQSYKYKLVEDATIQTNGIFNDWGASYKTQAYPVINILPKNYSQNGNVDYTTYLQKAVDNNSVVLLPDFPILINDIGINLNTNSTIIFQKNSKLILAPTSKTRYSILKANGVNNVKILGANIEGDRLKHLGTEGEWGYGIEIKSSSNVLIQGGIIKNCWGDGICIGRSTAALSRNITIKNCLIDNNRRNALTIGSGDAVSVQNSIFANSNGTFPMAGIDLEPDNSNDDLKNINISNVTTFNNAQDGIIISPDNLRSKDNTNGKTLSITIQNHVDKFSRVGLSLLLAKEKNLGGPINGNIDIINPKWIYSRAAAFKNYVATKNNIKINIKNPAIRTEGNGSLFKNNLGVNKMLKEASINPLINIQ